jgi:hypothetical protein
VLDHEEQALAEIASHLRLEAPDLDRLLRADMAEVAELLAARHHEPSARARRRRARAFGRAATALVVAVVVTALATLALGPDTGGLVGAIGLTLSATYAYQRLQGCPGRRAAGRHRRR